MHFLHDERHICLFLPRDVGRTLGKPSKVQFLTGFLNQFIYIDLVTLNAVLQVLSTHFQKADGFCDIAAAGTQSFANHIMFDALNMTV